MNWLPGIPNIPENTSLECFVTYEVPRSNERHVRIMHYVNQLQAYPRGTIFNGWMMASNCWDENSFYYPINLTVIAWIPFPAPKSIGIEVVIFPDYE